jgi:A/G-specific adenine glycosylase
MAQQTRLETMLPYYRRWMKLFPSIRSLANSREQDVLSIWEGLGYYSRARNLRRAAQLVLDRHKGRLPADVDALLALPGIGRYTAGAIASMAFGLDEPAVDGNAIRVLARVFNVKSPVGGTKAVQRFWELAAEYLPRGRAADYNQALMDLGASLCKPRRPDCPLCPLRADCRAYALGIQEKLPVRKRAGHAPIKHIAAAVIKQRSHVLVMQRPASGLLAGLWEFPNVDLESPADAKSMLRRGLRKRLGFSVMLSQEFGQYDHAYSHFSVRLQVFESKLNGRRPKLETESQHRWISIHRLNDLPMGKLDRQIASSLRDNASKR